MYRIYTLCENEGKDQGVKMYPPLLTNVSNWKCIMKLFIKSAVCTKKCKEWTFYNIYIMQVNDDRTN